MLELKVLKPDAFTLEPLEFSPRVRTLKKGPKPPHASPQSPGGSPPPAATPQRPRRAYPGRQVREQPAHREHRAMTRQRLKPGVCGALVTAQTKTRPPPGSVDAPPAGVSAPTAPESTALSSSSAVTTSNTLTFDFKPPPDYLAQRPNCKLEDWLKK